MKRKLSPKFLIKIVIYLKYLPLIISKIKNWPSFILNYAGIKNQGATYIFRNGFKIKTKDGISSSTIAVNFIKKDYGKVADNSLVIDIGANMGAYSIFANQSKGTVIYAFESNLDNFELLKENIELNKGNILKGNILAFNLAVGARKEKRKLYLGESPFHSFYPIKESPFNAFYGDQVQEKKQKYSEINSVSLQDVFDQNKIENCDILKIDCEGAEFEILYNLPKEYFKRIKNIRLEYHNHLNNKENNVNYLIKFLEDKNFKVIKIKRSSNYQGDLWLTQI